MKKIRIIDVANRADVSKSTVSQYLNGRYEFMSVETRERVKKAIKELNYVPNPMARSLKTDKTKTIGVIVRDVTGFFTSKVIRGIDDFCKNSEYNVLIYNTDFDPDVEKRSLKILKDMRVDGIIIMSSGKNNSLIAGEQLSGFPIVQVQMEYDDVTTSIVLSDYRKAAFEATEYLIGLGHKRICFLTQEYIDNKSRYDRFSGYKDALEKHNIELDETLIQFWDREKSFYTSPNQLLTSIKPPTAFFCQHLAITVDLLRTLNKSSVNIPDDVSVLGFDEVPMVELLSIPVTVVSQSPYNIGSEAANILLQKIKDKNPEIIKKVLPCTLIERQSCKKLN